MKHLRVLLTIVSIAGLTVLAWGQLQVQPQTDLRTEPIYPRNPSYNFYSEQRYAPFQFNWAAGRWDYVPFPPGGSSAGFGSEPPLPPVPYGYPVQPSPDFAPATPNTSAQPQTNAAPQANDEDLWSGPTTQPQSNVKIAKFEGRIIAIEAITLMGDSDAHVLVRLQSQSGAKGTIDIGQKLRLPEKGFDLNGTVAATGPLGMIDGKPVLFANQIAVGSQTIAIQR